MVSNCIVYELTLTHFASLNKFGVEYERGILPPHEAFHSGTECEKSYFEHDMKVQGGRGETKQTWSKIVKQSKLHHLRW